jgi:hypothetical protein
MISKRQIEDRLVEAGQTLKRLHLVGDEARHIRRANQSSMPEFVRRYVESYGHDEATLPPPRPSAIEISRMDEALGWLSWCYSQKGLYAVMLARALGVPFRRIAALDPAEQSQTTIKRRFQDGLDIIFRSLNGLADGAWRTETSAIASLKAAMVLHPRIWSHDERDAWLFGIVVGWSANELATLANLHGWTDADLERLHRHRAALGGSSLGNVKIPLSARGLTHGRE